MMTSEGHCAIGVIVNNILNWRPCWSAIPFEEFIWSFGVFSSQFATGIVSYAGTTIIHGYFIAITFAGSFGRYLNTLPSGLEFKQLPRDLEKLMHEKPWVIPIPYTLKFKKKFLGNQCRPRLNPLRSNLIWVCTVCH